MHVLMTSTHGNGYAGICTCGWTYSDRLPEKIGRAWEDHKATAEGRMGSLDQLERRA